MGVAFPCMGVADPWCIGVADPCNGVAEPLRGVRDPCMDDISPPKPEPELLEWALIAPLELPTIYTGTGVGMRGNVIF